MNKVLAIAWKDTAIRFRDRNGLIAMLAAPLIIAAIIGSAFGGFASGGGQPPLTDIPLIIVNGDGREGSQQFIDLFRADNLAELFALQEMDDLATARDRIQQGEVRGVIYLPPNFSDAVAGTDEATVQLYTDPAANISPYILQSVLAQVIDGYSSLNASGQIFRQTLPEAIQATSIIPQQEEVTALFQAQGEAIAQGAGGITFNTIDPNQAEDEEPINIMGYFAPSMGIFFLMFTMFEGARSILAERRDGTLHRLLTTPTHAWQILLGKIGGVFLTGFLQLGIYIIVSSVVFQIEWGSSYLGVFLLVLAVVLAFTSLGAVLSAFAQDINQASVLGLVTSLLLAVLGGNFVQTTNFPAWLQQISQLTPNYWAIEAFTQLSIGKASLSEILPHVGALLLMSVVLFVFGVWQFGRRIQPQ